MNHLSHLVGITTLHQFGLCWSDIHEEKVSKQFIVTAVQIMALPSLPICLAVMVSIFEHSNGADSFSTMGNKIMKNGEWIVLNGFSFTCV